MFGALEPIYLEWKAFYKSYHNVASPEGARLIGQGYGSY